MSEYERLLASYATANWMAALCSKNPTKRSSFLSWQRRCKELREKLMEYAQ